MKIQSKLHIRVKIIKPVFKRLDTQLCIKQLLFYCVSPHANWPIFHLRNERYKIWRVKSW